MYYLMVIGLMVVAPLVSIGIELAVSGPANVLEVVGKWFLFWGVGVRLLIAGISQSIRPEFTAQNILGEKSSSANQIVRELGFANIGFGVVGLVAPWVAGWAVPGAIAPAIFLGVAGILHIIKRGKNSKEWVATTTDLLVAVVLAVFVIGSLLTLN
ncbi:hypothetical protein BH10ACT7_BH10ACT7_23740 [soil metagenome]